MREIKIVKERKSGVLNVRNIQDSVAAKEEVVAAIWFDGRYQDWFAENEEAKSFLEEQCGGAELCTRVGHMERTKANMHYGVNRLISYVERNYVDATYIASHPLPAQKEDEVEIDDNVYIVARHHRDENSGRMVKIVKNDFDPNKGDSWDIVQVVFINSPDGPACLYQMKDLIKLNKL